MSQKPVFITTSIAYVNGEPHVGFAMECVEADALARWARLQGREVFLSTGTDEHGEKIQKTADAQGRTPQEICDTNTLYFQKLVSDLHISHDVFIRTSDQEKHWTSAQKIWKRLEEKGDIELRTYTDTYCYGCEAFLTPKELNEKGECPHHLRKPEEISEENYFFKLSQYSDQIADLIASDTLKITPSFRKNEILQMAKSGFHDVPFSRPSTKLPWGAPVPGDSSQNMYVWCDALVNYFSALGYGNEPESEDFHKFWNEGEVTHVIGKDIVRFHAGIWIGMLLSAGIKIPNTIFVHGFLTSEGQKMSKSLGNIVDPFAYKDRYGTDALRYFLLREVPVGQDADFSEQRFAEVYQAHLANGLGNLVSRVANLCKKANIEPNTTVLSNAEYGIFLTTVEQSLTEKMQKYVLHDAISEVFRVVEFCDGEITKTKPWENMESEETHIFLQDIQAMLLWIGKYIVPFLPETGEKITELFQHPITDIPMLFPRLEKLNAS